MPRHRDILSFGVSLFSTNGISGRASPHIHQFSEGGIPIPYQTLPDGVRVDIQRKE